MSSGPRRWFNGRLQGGWRRTMAWDSSRTFYKMKYRSQKRFWSRIFIYMALEFFKRTASMNMGGTSVTDKLTERQRRTSLLEVFKVSNEEINIHSNIIFQRIWVTEHPIPLKHLQVLSNMRSYAYACVSSGFQLECKNNNTAYSWKASLHCAQAVALAFHLECLSICTACNWKVSPHCVHARESLGDWMLWKKNHTACNWKISLHYAHTRESSVVQLDCKYICIVCN